MRSKKKNFIQKKALEREIKLGVGILVLFGFMGLAIFAGIRGLNGSFDSREKASGKTYFVNNSKELEDSLAKAADSDAIFLKVGNYTTSSDGGFVIKNKNIRILGAGEGFTEVSGNNHSYVFQVQNSSASFESLRIRGANKDGILVTNSNGKEVLIKDVEITSNSGTGLNTNGKTTVTNSLINQNGSGIISLNGELTIRNTVVQNSASNGIEIKQGSTSKSEIENVILTKNKGTGILLSGGQSHNIKNVTLAGNTNGLKEAVSTNLRLTNSLVIDSEKEGISLLANNANVKYNNSFNNKSSNYKPEALKNNEGNLSVAANTVSKSDFHLAQNSDLKDKGSPSDKDSDGTRADIGAYGGFASIDDANSAPTITSTPVNFVKAGQQYYYEVRATDPDGDALDYVVLNSNVPSWLKQNKNVFSGTPSESDVGFVGISLVVTDKKGHNVVHPISINVVSANRVVPTTTPTPRPTGSTTPTPQPTQPSQPQVVPSVKIISPTSSTKFDGNTAEVKWEVTNGANVEKIVLKYSSDKENYETIATVSPERNSHAWDISSLVNGSYLLKVEIYEKNSTTPIAAISDQFEIKKTVKDDSKPTITITRISPEDSDIIDNRKQNIIVEFTPKLDLDKTKTYLKVNGTNVEYQTSQSSLYYTPAQDYKTGNVTVEVKLVATNGAEDSKKWIFNIPTNTVSRDTTPDATEQNRINILGLKLPKPIGLIILAIIIFGLLVLILYFIVKLIRTIRDERQGNLEAEFTEYYEHPDNPHGDEYMTTQTSEYLTPETVDSINQYTVQENTYVAENTEPNQVTYDTTVDQNTYVENAAPNAESVTTTETAYTDVSSDQNVVPNETTDTYTEQTQFTPTDNVITETKSEDVIEDEDPYIAELKKKYNISPDQSFVEASNEETTDKEIQQLAGNNEQNLVETQQPTYDNPDNFVETQTTTEITSEPDNYSTETTTTAVKSDETQDYSDDSNPNTTPDPTLASEPPKKTV